MIRGRNFIGSRRVGPGPAPDRECDGGEESHDNGAHDGVGGSEIDRNCGEGAVVESGSGPEAALAAAVEAAIAPAAGGSAKLENLKVIKIKTELDGYNSGRIYYFRTRSDASTDVDIEEIVEELGRLAVESRINAENKSRFERNQLLVRRMCCSSMYQYMTALLITMNFVANATEAQMSESLSDETVDENIFKNLDVFFTSIFAADLLVNAYSFWMWDFLTSGWHLFDTFVVLMSLIALGPIRIPVSIIRLMRAFRVVRLFGRIKSLKNIISALSASIEPVLNAFFILFVIACIYAIIGNSLFSDVYPFKFGRFDRYCNAQTVLNTAE